MRFGSQPGLDESARKRSRNSTHYKSHLQVKLTMPQIQDKMNEQSAEFCMTPKISGNIFGDKSRNNASMLA